jgi:tryptophan 2,3-dioxygenase
MDRCQSDPDARTFAPPRDLAESHARLAAAKIKVENIRAQLDQSWDQTAWVTLRDYNNWRGRTRGALAYAREEVAALEAWIRSERAATRESPEARAARHAELMAAHQSHAACQHRLREQRARGDAEYDAKQAAWELLLRVEPTLHDPALRDEIARLVPAGFRGHAARVRASEAARSAAGEPLDPPASRP